jgi:two-component system, chemotaxis family, response regulator Rcp1
MTKIRRDTDAILAVKPAEVLLVEDNPSDVRLTREAMKEGTVVNNLHVVGDGQAAIDFLTRKPPYQNAPRPDLVLLDLNLPKKSGREVLAEIKANDSLKTIPIVVLTTSKAEEDVAGTYKLHANCFITKPVDLDKFIAVVHQVENFWLEVVRLPPRND